MSEEVEVALRKENERLLMANKDLIDWLNYARDQINLKDKENKRLREALVFYECNWSDDGKGNITPDHILLKDGGLKSAEALKGTIDWDNETTDNGPCS